MKYYILTNGFRMSTEAVLLSVCHQVHKVLLAATSEYFRVMFRGLMQESRQDSVDLKGVTADGLQHILQFIYSGELTLHYDNLTEIINTASHLQVSSALDVCSDYVNSLMTFENAEEFLSIADTYSLESVQLHWDNMILSNFQEFSQSQAFLKLSADSLSKYLASDSMRASSEFKLFKCLEVWFQGNRPRMMADGDKVLSHVRFPLMSEMELSHVQQTEVIRCCPTGARHLNKGFRYHMDCKTGHPVIDEVSTMRTDSPSLVLFHHGLSHIAFQVTAYNTSTRRFHRLFSDVNGSRDCRVSVVDNFAYICRVVDYGGGTLMSSLFRFDPRHLNAHELRPMRCLRLDFAVVTFKKSLYVFGGSTEQFAILDSVEVYNVLTNTWEDSLPLPTPTHSLAAVSFRDKIYLTGGVSGQDRLATNRFLCYNPEARTWENKPGMFYARRLHDMVVSKGKIFVLGGLPRQGVPLQGQIPIESFDFQSNQWTMLSSTLSGRSVGHYINFEDQILSLGHEHHSATEDEVWLYNSDIDDWSKYAKAPQRMSLTSSVCVSLFVNFYDEKVERNIIVG